MTPAGIEPATIRFVAQHYLSYTVSKYTVVMICRDRAANMSDIVVTRVV